MNEETALLQLTGDASVQQRFLEMSHLYDAAIREIRTRLEILDREFSILYASNPIHHIDSRLKSPRSILAKLERKELKAYLATVRSKSFVVQQPVLYLHGLCRKCYMEQIRKVKQTK